MTDINQPTEKETSMETKSKSVQWGLAIVAGILVLVGGVCLLTGCGGGSSGANPTPTPGPTEPPGLPPDPGDAGKATLEGIDVNHNGVRDDVEIAIYKRYPSDFSKRDVLDRGAKVLQDAIRAGGAIISGGATDPNQPFEVSKRIGFLTMCLGKRFGESGLEEIGFLEGILTNTTARQNAYSEYNGAVGKQSSGLPDTNTPCQDLGI